MCKVIAMEKKIHSTPHDKKGYAGEPTITAGMKIGRASCRERV